MTRLEALKQEFQRIAANPAAMVKEYRKKTGKGAVGILPIYAPEELVHAAGFLPVGIWGGQTPITKARAYLAPFACSIMQSVMEFELSGVYDDLAAVLISSPCDTLKCFGQKWKAKCPAIQFVHPQNRNLESANTFLVEEYKIIRSKLESILGVKITEEAIRKSIEIYNENRRAMRDFVAAAEKYPQEIRPAERHAVIKSRYFMEKSQHTALVRDLIRELENLEVRPWTGKRVLLTGITAEPDGLLWLLDKYGFAVAADDLAQESRQFRNDVPDGTDPLYRLARWWQDVEACSVATDRKKSRVQLLCDLVKEHRADGVIFCMMKFCDPEEFDYPILCRRFQEEKIPNLYLEIDQETTSFGQVETRVQSFADVLNEQNEQREEQLS